MEHTNRKTLGQLFVPCFLEYTLLMLVGVIDVIMVSAVGDAAVGAVGTSNTYLHLVSMILCIASTGALTVMTQNIGAGKPEAAEKAKNIGLLFNLGVGLVFSLIFLLFAGNIHTLLATADALYADAVTYIRVVGASCVFLALTNTYSAYLRSFGYAKYTFFAATVGNVVNVILNAVFLMCGMAVFGIALATLIARIITLCLDFLFARKIRRYRAADCTRPSKELLSDILRIGLPAAGESVAYSLCMSYAMHCINVMDTDGIAASVYAYCNQIGNLISCTAMGLSQANAILVGWTVGDGDFAASDRQTRFSLRIGLIASLGLALLGLLLAKPAIAVLTDDTAILSFVIPVMAVNILRECGRAGNLIVGSALKTAGDALTTLYIGIVCMPVCAFLGGFLLGRVLGLGIVGAWIGFMLDEGVRSILMYARWKSRKWESKALVGK